MAMSLNIGYPGRGKSFVLPETQKGPTRTLQKLSGRVPDRAGSADRYDGRTADFGPEASTALGRRRMPPLRQDLSSSC